MFLGNQKGPPKASKKHSIKMEFHEYIGNAIHVAIVGLSAEFLLRIFRAAYEHIYFKNHYLPNPINIYVHAFTFTNYSIILIIVVAIAALVHFGPSSQLIPPMKYFMVSLLYLIWSICNVSHSTLTYTHFIRERTGLDYGEGMASSYFHGYLKLILPSGALHGGGIKSRIKQFEAEHNIKFAENRLVILIPNTLYTSPTIESEYLEHSHHLESVVRNRAGVLRNYKNDVYRITEPIHGQFYYVVLEGATPLLSFFDSLHFQLSCTVQMEMLQREILFKFYKSLEKLLAEWPETQNTCKLLFYNTTMSDGQKVDVGEILLNHYKSSWNKTNST